MLPSLGSIFRKKILVIDPDPGFRELFSVALRSDSLEIKCAENGRIGQDILTTETFDLILLDFRIPGLDGLQLIKQLRERGDFTRIIVASSLMPAKAVLDAVSYGVTCFINKPANLTLLRKVTYEHLSDTDTPRTKAFRLARQLNFNAACEQLESSLQSNTELATWHEVFKALSQGEQGDALSKFEAELMEIALAHN